MDCFIVPWDDVSVLKLLSGFQVRGRGSRFLYPWPWNGWKLYWKWDLEKEGSLACR